MWGEGRGGELVGRDEIVGFRWFSQIRLFLGPDLYLPNSIPGPYGSLLFPSLDSETTKRSSRLSTQGFPGVPVDLLPEPDCGSTTVSGSLMDLGD